MGDGLRHRLGVAALSIATAAIVAAGRHEGTPNNRGTALRLRVG